MSSAVNSKPTLLAIETSCDETAIAILSGSELLASEVASQIAEHEPYGGVVPEVASRNHLLHAPFLLERVLQSADILLRDIDAFAATAGPGLASSLMIGTSIVKGLALGHRKPYLAINHLEGHLLSPFFGGQVEPNVSLVVSGGHTLLVEVRDINDYRVLGRTVDDAAGEAFDKVAKTLGLGYPGGPEIERHAKNGDPERFDLPRSMLDSRDHNFSFSGLKTAVRYLLPKIVGRFYETPTHDRRLVQTPCKLDEEVLVDLCASFQAAVIDVLVQKTVRAAREIGAKLVAISGGVSCNGELRAKMEAACDDAGLKFVAAASQLCTDNAAMIAFAAALRLRNGFESNVREEIDPNLALVPSG